MYFQPERRVLRGLGAAAPWGGCNPLAARGACGTTTLSPNSHATTRYLRAPAPAQTTFRLGLRGGANRALTTPEAANASGFGFTSSADKSPIYAWQAGVVLEVNHGKFAFQPAIAFSQKGEKINTTETYGDFGVYTTKKTSSNRYNWLELPLNVVYTMHGDHGLQLFAGPYVALAVGGRQRGTTFQANPFAKFAPQEFDDKAAFGSSTNNRRLDAGINFGVGYRQGPLQVQLGYGLGLRNLHQDNGVGIDPGFSINYHNFNADAAYNRVAQLTGTYFFSL